MQKRKKNIKKSVRRILKRVQKIDIKNWEDYKECDNKIFQNCNKENFRNLSRKSKKKKRKTTKQKFNVILNMQKLKEKY